jgi:hypothetical protein
MSNQLSTNSTVPRSTLYPIAFNRQTSDLAASLLASRETDRDGTPLLPVLATPTQRGLLLSRQRELAAALTPGKSSEIAKAIGQMLIGFGAREDDAGSRAKIAAYVTVLQHLPLWAVVRACARFSRGDVKPEEIQERFITRGKEPSTAHVHIIASRIVQGFRDEQADIREVLRARLAFTPSKEEQAKVAAGLKALADDLKLKPMPETPHDRAYRERGEVLARKREHVLAPTRREAAEQRTASPELIALMAEQDARPVAPKPKHADESR